MEKMFLVGKDFEQEVDAVEMRRLGEFRFCHCNCGCTIYAQDFWIYSYDKRREFFEKYPLAECIVLRDDKKITSYFIAGREEE